MLIVADAASIRADASSVGHDTCFLTIAQLATTGNSKTQSKRGHIERK